MNAWRVKGPSTREGGLGVAGFVQGGGRDLPWPSLRRAEWLCVAEGPGPGAGQVLTVPGKESKCSNSLLALGNSPSLCGLSRGDTHTQGPSPVKSNGTRDSR